MKEEKIIKLEDGEIICSQCHGTGKPNNNKINYKDPFLRVPKDCDKCYGSGKLDWIENIVGKEKPISYDYRMFYNYYRDFHNKTNSAFRVISTQIS